MIIVFGGGEIARRGILPAAGGNGQVAGPDVVDVRSWTSTYRFMLNVAQVIGALEWHAVFAAGISRPASVLRSDPAEWLNEALTNQVGGYHVARAALARGAKTFIAIASLAGLYGKPEHSGYSASKAGLISLVQSLAMEGHNAYAISPGRVNTAMREKDYPGEDPATRLDPLLIGAIVRDMIAGKYTPGDNVVIRMRGHDVLPLEIHRGDGWAERLRVGQPATC